MSSTGYLMITIRLWLKLDHVVITPDYTQNKRQNTVYGSFKWRLFYSALLQQISKQKRFCDQTLELSLSFSLLSSLFSLLSLSRSLSFSLLSPLSLFLSLSLSLTHVSRIHSSVKHESTSGSRQADFDEVGVAANLLFCLYLMVVSLVLL